MNHYLAFISYRHKPLDQRVSFLLRKYLESFHLPLSCPIPKRRKCFRDTDELPTSTDLGADIEHALETSDYLIAVCSEDYVQSKWCMREIELYIEQGKKDKILPVLISGTAETSVPEKIRDLPVVLDLRGLNRGKIREQIPALISVMSDTKAEEIAAADRRHRNLVLAETFGGISILILSVIAYAMATARSIEKNNEQIIQATADAIQAEEDANEQIADYYLKRAGHLTHKAWTAIRQGNDLDALEYTMNALDDYDFETPDYVDILPESTEAVDALRMALAMPGRQRIRFSYWRDVGLWENLDYDDPEDIGFHFTGKYTENHNSMTGGTDFQDAVFDFETNSADGKYCRVYFEGDDSEGEADPVILEKNIDPALRKEGYAHVYLCPDGTRLLYGGSAQMVLRGSAGISDIAYCINGEPFSADDIWTSQGDAQYIIASDSYQTALFRRDVPEAVRVLPIEGTPVCAAYNHSITQAAVIDSAGVLSLFLTDDGTRAGTLDGLFQYVTYANENYKLYAITSEGEFRQIDALSLETEKTFEIPLPAKAASYCARKNLWLLLADHAAFILDGTSGERLNYIVFTGGSLACAWEGFDPVSYTHEGNGFLVIGDDTVNFFRIQDQADTFLHLLLAAEGYSRDCKKVHYFYYPDKYSTEEEPEKEPVVFLEYDNGDLSRWDIDWTDPYKWASKTGWRQVQSTEEDVYFSEDGSVIWRTAWGGYGIEKIDIETGATIYQAKWPQKCSIRNIQERWDGWYGLTPGKKGELPMVLFDQDTGEFLWSAPAVCGAVFGDEICCLDIRPSAGSSEGKQDLVFLRLDDDDGSILEEKILCTLEDGEAGEVTVDPDELTASVDGMWLVDLYEVTVKRTEPAQEDQPLVFAGQEVSIVNQDGVTLLVNSHDGHTIIDAGDQQIQVSPEGESLVLYGGSKTPYLIFSSDTDDLLSEAIYRRNQREEEDEEEDWENWDSYWDDDWDSYDEDEDDWDSYDEDEDDWDSYDEDEDD